MNREDFVNRFLQLARDQGFIVVATYHGWLLLKYGWPVMFWICHAESWVITPEESRIISVGQGIANTDIRVVYPHDWEDVVVPMITGGTLGGVQ